MIPVYRVSDERRKTQDELPFLRLLVFLLLAGVLIAACARDPAFV